MIKLGATYHMFASAITGNCSLKQFSTNSMSVRATSASPGGPFAFAETVLPPFHHSTTVVEAGPSMPSSPNGLLMFSIGIDTHGANLHHCNATWPPPPLPPNCTEDMAELGCVRGGRSGCMTCINSNRQRIPADACWSSNCPDHKCYSNFRKAWCTGVEQDFPHVARADDVSTGIGPHDYMSITTAPSVAGPWNERVIFKTDPSAEVWNCNKSNPSPVVLRNGTILLMYRGQYCKRHKDCRTATQNTCERQGIAVAKDATSPFVDRQGDIAELAGNEDAFFWQGKRGFHAIFHSKNACGQEASDVNSCGSLAWSEDSWTWHLNKVPAYTKTIIWKNDERKEGLDTTAGTLLSRQRPKILFDDNGYTPLFLYNGVKTELTEHEWTLAVPFHSTSSNVVV